ncbi:MAG: hypothetical protein V2A55_03110 [Candidatus Jorgensenbacteria bacterium]
MDRSKNLTAFKKNLIVFLVSLALSLATAYWFGLVIRKFIPTGGGGHFFPRRVYRLSYRFVWGNAVLLNFVF